MLEKVIGLLKESGYKVGRNDKTVSFLLDRTTEKALNYCNLKKLPQEMESHIIEMCVASCIQMKNVNKASQDLSEGLGAVTSIKEGNEQTNFDAGASNTALIHAYTDRIFNESKKELNRFRKLRR